MALTGRPRGLQLTDRDRLVLDHIPLVLAEVGRRFVRGVDRDDLVHAGVVGLLVATDRYEPDRGVPFGAFARAWVRKEVDRLVAAQAFPVAVPVNLHASAQRLAAHGAVTDRNTEPLSSAVAEALRRAGLPASSPFDLAGDFPSPEGEALDALFDQELADALDAMPSLVREIVERRYRDPSLSLRATGDRLNVSVSTVRTALRRAAPLLAHLVQPSQERQGSAMSTTALHTIVELDPYAISLRLPRGWDVSTPLARQGTELVRIASPQGGLGVRLFKVPLRPGGLEDETARVRNILESAGYHSFSTGTCTVAGRTGIQLDFTHPATEGEATRHSRYRNVTRNGAKFNVAFGTYNWEQDLPLYESICDSVDIPEVPAGSVMLPGSRLGVDLPDGWECFAPRPDTTELLRVVDPSTTARVTVSYEFAFHRDLEAVAAGLRTRWEHATGRGIRVGISEGVPTIEVDGDDYTRVANLRQFGDMVAVVDQRVPRSASLGREQARAIASSLNER